MKRTLKILCVALLVMSFMAGCSKKEAKTEEVETKATETVTEEAENDEPSILVPVEARIETGADFDALETLPIGKYQISDTSKEIVLEVYENVQYEITARITDGDIIENLYQPVLIKNGESIYLYGKVDYSRVLERVQIMPDYILKKETNVVWTDFPAKTIKKCAGEYNTNGFVTLGETLTENGWHYAIYSNGKELASIDMEEKLNFFYDEGIAINDKGEVYLLYYTANSMEAYEVELPEKVDPEGFAAIDDRYSNGYGYTTVYINDNDFYVIKTDEIEALKMNGLNHLDKGFSPLNKKPSYTVIKGEPENFEIFETWFGGDSLGFGMNCYLNYNDEYSYRYDTYLFDKVEKNYLGLIIPDEELDKVWNKTYTSYSEVEEAIEELNEFLDDWESNHLSEILEEINADEEFWKTFYPDVALRYGVN